MDDLEEKMGAILNNPNMMQQIMSLAQTMGQNAPPGPEKQSEKSQQPPQDSAPLPEIDLSMLQKLSGFARQSSIDKNQQNLLRALSPYLSRDRISRLERAMRAAKMATMASSFFGQKSRSGR